MLAADALQEMLLQNYDGIVRVFPAIPKEWRENGTSFTDFRGGKGVLVSSEIKNSEVQYISLKAEKEGIFRIENTFSSSSLILQKGHNKEMISVKQGNIFEIKLNIADECVIYIAK